MVTQVVQSYIIAPLAAGTQAFSLTLVLAAFSPALAGVLAATWLPLLALGWYFSKRLRARFRVARETNSSLTSRIQESLAGVRVMVVGGGCSGLTYDMDFEHETREGDTVVEHEGVKVFVDPMSLAYLEGTRIDFIETFSYAGFQFDNPNAQKGCGCGKSFSV